MQASFKQPDVRTVIKFLVLLGKIQRGITSLLLVYLMMLSTAYVTQHWMIDKIISEKWIDKHVPEMVLP